MRIFLHDFGGYPFITDLSRELARRGHRVDHVYNARLTAGQDVAPRAEDPAELQFVPIRTRQHFDKYSIARRVPIEVEYGRRVSHEIRRSQPDVVLSANTPLFSQRWLARAARREGAKFVFWLQDLLGVGIAGELERRFGRVGRWSLASSIEAMERRLLRSSDHVVAISPRFVGVLDRWGVPWARRTVLPNWAPLWDAAADGRERSWAQDMALPDRPLALYAGTLGRKHDPTLLLNLAWELHGIGEVVVVSEGPIVDQLASSAAAAGLQNLHTLPFQPFRRLPEMLACADVLLTLLTADASNFSVPSKVMTYLVAGRPIAASMPLDNPAAEILREHEAGLVSDVGDRQSFVASVRKLVQDPDRAARLGANGRAYAEEHFDLRAIGDRFEGVLTEVVHCR